MLGRVPGRLAPPTLGCVGVGRVAPVPGLLAPPALGCVGVLGRVAPVLGLLAPPELGCVGVLGRVAPELGLLALPALGRVVPVDGLLIDGERLDDAERDAPPPDRPPPPPPRGPRANTSLQRRAPIALTPIRRIQECLILSPRIGLCLVRWFVPIRRERDFIAERPRLRRCSEEDLRPGSVGSIAE